MISVLLAESLVYGAAIGTVLAILVVGFRKEGPK
jgi:hypothetical protein